MSIRNKIILSFLIIIIVLSSINVASIISSIDQYQRYNAIVSNITTASSMNSNFKAEIDSVMYRIIAGNLQFEEGRQYKIIEDATNSIHSIINNTNTTEGRTKLNIVLNAMHTLTGYVDVIGKQIKEKKTVEENEQVLEEIHSVSGVVDDKTRDFMLYELARIGSVNAQIQQSSDSWLLTEVVVMGFVFIFSILAVWFIASAISKPIRALQIMTTSVGEGNLDVRVESSNKDEITALGKSFNRMTEQLKELIEKERREQENLKKAEMKALQAQINPHFLYNTLDAIVWMAEANKSKEVIKIVGALSSFFRTTLSKGRDWITVNNEVEHVRSYLTIQKVRYNDILDYRIDVDQAMMDYSILKLTLQPIVENALYHGIKNKRAKGVIMIKGRMQEGGLMVFTITDDGIGMTPERLAEVQAELNDEQGEMVVNESGFGLNNVHKRIKLYYGPEYGLAVESSVNTGTRVTITIPAERN
jgi:two-component system, sensor histidine kinase YesM